MKSALPSPLLLTYVLVTCVPNLISKRKTGFSTVRKHIIRHRAIFEVSLQNSTANFRKTALCGGSPARNFENFKTDGKFFDFFFQWAYAVYMVANSRFRDRFSTCIAVSRPFWLMFEQIPSLTQSYCPGEPVAACWIQLEPNSAWQPATHRYRLAVKPILDLKWARQNRAILFQNFSVIAACLIILTIQPKNFRKPALSGGSPAQNFGKFKTDRKFFRFFTTLINPWH